MMAYDMFLPDLHPCSGSGQDMVQFDLAWLQYNPEFMLELICGALCLAVVTGNLYLTRLLSGFKLACALCMVWAGSSESV